MLRACLRGAKRNNPPSEVTPSTCLFSKLETRDNEFSRNPYFSRSIMMLLHKHSEFFTENYEILIILACHYLSSTVLVSPDTIVINSSNCEPRASQLLFSMYENSSSKAVSIGVWIKLDRYSMSRSV